MKRYLGAAIAFFFAATIFLPATRAQDQSAPPEQAQEQDAQDSTQVQPVVGHISFIHGNVSVQRGDSGDWIAATLNTPIESGDRISTGENSRAEVQLDYANLLRLEQDSTAKITDLTQNHIQVQVGQGLVSYGVLQNSQADAEIDTPNSAVHPLRQGEYRVEVDNDSQTQVIVRDGQAEVSEPQGSTRVESGQLITIQGTDSPQYQIADAPNRDDFDNWNQSRDRTIESANSWQHTDRYYTGSQDLDAYGHWENVPDYGQVWVPAQNSGWAPYRDGDWQWEPYYGWTWVSYEPWGWAPYHYGRWFAYGGDWVWWPGPIGVYGGWGYRPIWSPAYVSFFGWGGGVSFGFGFGNVGWLPCGPGDFFTPWWGFGVTNITFINFRDRDDFRFRDRDDFRFRGVGDRDFGRREDPLFRGKNGFSNIGRFENDARIRAGVTSVRGEDFGHSGGKFEHGGVGTQQFQKANFMTGKLPAVPNRQSLGRVQEHITPAIARTSGANNQHFFSQSRPAFTPRPFSEQVAAQQHAIENSRGQAGAGNSRFSAPATQQHGGNSAPTTETLRPGVARVPSAPAQANNSARTTETLRPGTARMPAAPAQSQPRSTPQQMQVRPGWHSFGENGNGNARVQGQANLPNRPSSMQQLHQNPTPMRMQQQNQAPPRMEQQSPSRPSGNWHQFTPPSQQSRPAQRPGNPHPQSGWGNFSQPNRSYGNSGNYSRPQLDMRQPVVRQQRAPSYSAPRSYGGRNYSRPSSSYSLRSFGGGGGSGGSRGGGGGSRGGSSHPSSGRPH